MRQIKARFHPSLGSNFVFFLTLTFFLLIHIYIQMYCDRSLITFSSMAPFPPGLTTFCGNIRTVSLFLYLWFSFPPGSTTFCGNIRLVSVYYFIYGFPSPRNIPHFVVMLDRSLFNTLSMVSLPPQIYHILW